MNAKNKLLLFGIYSKLLSDGRLYGTKQTRYRIMASTWLFATLAACGILLSSEELLPIDHLLAVVIVCSLGSLATYAVWYEDTITLETLLDISVIEALKIESKNPFIPQLHHRFLHLFSRGSAPHVKAFFFVGCKTILIILVTISFGIYLYPISSLYSILSVIITIAINIFSTRIMIKKNLQISALIKELQNVDP